MLKQINIGLSNGTCSILNKPLHEGEPTELLKAARVVSQLNSVLSELNFDEGTYEVEVTVKADKKLLKKAENLITEKIKPMPPHSLLENLCEKERNVGFVLAHGFSRKEARDLVGMKEGTFKKFAGNFYRAVGDKRIATIVKRCNDEGWFKGLGKFMFAVSALLADGIPCLA